MEEYNKINWNLSDLSELEKVKLEFLPVNYILDSYVYNKPETAASSVKVERTKNFKHNLYVPGKLLKVFQDKKLPVSSLSKMQHQQCLIALKCHQTGKALNSSEKLAMDTFQSLYTTIIEENQLFLDRVKQDWNKKLGSVNKIKPVFQNQMEQIWKRSLDRYLRYPNFYREVVRLPLSFNENDCDVEVKYVKILKEFGEMAKCVVPTLKAKVTLQMKSFPKNDERILNSKLPVSEDKNVNLFKEDFSVVISSGALKCLLDEDVNEWNIPIVVKNNTETKGNVIYIDKPLPSFQPTKTDFNRKCFKLLLKSNFCQYKAFSYSNQETNETHDQETTEDLCPRKILHNVSYRLWEFRPKVETSGLLKTNIKQKTINVIVRCKLDGCEATDNQTLQPVILTPHIEYQLEWGARTSTRNELQRDWTSMFFRPYSKNYRVRIDCFTGTLVQIETCTLQKINTEASSQHQFKPHLGLRVLYKCFASLLDLEPGNYLLHHEAKYGSFASLMKECPESGTNVFNLREGLGEAKVSLGVPQWSPIDVSVVLPKHAAHEQMPGLFRGHERKTGGFKRKKGAKGIKKRKTKR